MIPRKSEFKRSFFGEGMVSSVRALPLQGQTTNQEYAV